MLTYNHIIGNTPAAVRKRAKKVTAVITRAEMIKRGSKKGIKFSATGRAATEKVYYNVEIELYPERLQDSNQGKKGFVLYDRPDENTECFVHCTCPYFLFNCAWVLTKYGSSRLGDCDNKAPHITNPTMEPYPCKHIFKSSALALRAIKNIAVK